MPSDTTSVTQSAATSHTPSRLGDAAGDVLDQAGRTAERQASTAMTKAGDTLDQVARAVRDSGDQLRTDRPEIANVADTAAQRVEEIATYLRAHDAREILDEAERIARRQPALVVGGGLLLGLIAGRLLRSGAEPTTSNGSAQYWSGGAGSGSGAHGEASYRGASGWSGGGSSDVSSSRPAGSSMPTSGYGTGYGATYDSTVDDVPSTAAGNLAATDAAATDAAATDSTSGTSTTRSSASRSASKRRTGATGGS
ncbi:MAG TPA: hypothetical protein VFJ71_03475 [Candidatus Limnocylindrales bacterium]|nr:hypothetical protein [Candidatus Limnocylindrales bacterium]